MNFVGEFMKQLSFASFTVKTKKIKAEKFLEEMDKIIPWDQLVEIITSVYAKKGNGRSPMDLLLMIRIYCLQQWYNLGDAAMEESIYDRASFQRFLGIDLMLDAIPDETTILNFRHLLEEYKLTEKIFAQMNKHLESKGLIMKKGTIVDASIIVSPSSTKNKDGKRDAEMSSTRKNGQYYFGMKTHIGVDSQSGLTHSCEVTTAKITDIETYPLLLHGEEFAIFGDKGYCSDKEKQYARDAEISWCVSDKKKPGKSLSGKQKKRNKLYSGIRCKVEFVFNVIKHLWGHKKTRYRGLNKNKCQWHFLLMLSNFYLSRKHLLQSC